MADTDQCIQQCLEEAYGSSLSTNQTRSTQDDLLLEWLPSSTLQELTEKLSEATIVGDKYYQYHIYDLIVFDKHARHLLTCLTTYMKDTEQLYQRYGRQLSFCIHKQRKCMHSKSTTIQLIVRYLRAKNRQKEHGEQFVQDSGLQAKLSEWQVSYCTTICYTSPQEYIKFMCTYGLDSMGCNEGSVVGGCLVSDTEDRFIALELDWTDRHSDDTDDDGEDTTSGDGKTIGENAIDSSADAGVSGAGGGDDDDSISDANTSDEEGGDVTLSVDRPAIASTTPAHSRSHATSSERKVPTEPGVLRLMSAPPRTSTTSEKDNNKSLNERERQHLKRLTTFRAHGQCGHHRLSVVARDPHPRSDCVVYHSQTYDRRDGREYSDKKTYFMPASGTLLAASLGTSSSLTKSKKRKQPITECTGENMAPPPKQPKKKKSLKSQEDEKHIKL